VFASTLWDVSPSNVATPITVWSVCNEIDRYIYTTGSPPPGPGYEVSNDSNTGPGVPLNLTGLTAAQKASLGTWDLNGVNPTSYRLSGNANVGGIAYMVANYMQLAGAQNWVALKALDPTLPGDIGDLGFNAAQWATDVASALQLAVWKEWGFQDVGGSGSAVTYGLSQLNPHATAVYNYLLGKAANNTAYTSPNVYWLRLSANTGDIQDQIVYVANSDIHLIVPEASSLALLLPGLLPVALLLMKRTRKS
jgi:hypothetical protein